MKSVLITGANSYVGTSVEKWLMKEPDKYHVDTVDMIDGTWREKNFSGYDVVFHVAGIAHVSTDPKMEDLYYKVNRDLAIETASKAKNEGVKQFIFMSSIIVYGDSTESKRVITKETVPKPSNFYGKSKLQAEEGIMPMNDDAFKVVVVRPPMIYGKGCKGNYVKLSKLAQKTPIFPDFDNERSMLHIDNLCEFIKVIINYEESGLFYPQNREYVKTSELVRLIAGLYNKKILMTKAFNPLIKLLFKLNVIRKMFGNLVYDKEMSLFMHTRYAIRELNESVKISEN